VKATLKKPPKLSSDARPSSKKTFELFFLKQSDLNSTKSSKVCLGSDGIFVLRGEHERT